MNEIYDIDETPADPMDLAEICNDTYCNNCSLPWNGVSKIVFVRLADGKLLWWHIPNCTKHEIRNKQTKSV
jgi:hypothetical protein